MSTKKEIETLKEISEELLKLMTVSAKIEVSFDKENDTFILDIESENETGLLIGKKGETLLSLQTILGIMLKQKIGEWKRIVVNVGDYREKEEDYLKNLTASAIARAKETGEPQSLYNLKAWQRRVVHMSVSEDPSVISESQGEGEERYLVIKSKK